jgi:hypothetical protein
VKELSQGRLLLAAGGLIVLVLLYGLRGKEAVEHRENLSSARDNLLGRGCVRGGVPPERLDEMARCVEEARKRCRSAAPRDVEDCAASR